MRHESSGKRSRSRGNGNRRGGQNKSRVYDSNGPDVRIRGTAHQVYDKYIGLAKDAAGSGDHILAESYKQHAEHYQRMISGWMETVENIKYHDDVIDYENLSAFSRQELQARTPETGDRTPRKTPQKSKEKLQKEMADA